MTEQEAFAAAEKHCTEELDGDCCEIAAHMWNAALAWLRSQGEPPTDSCVQTVPDKCDRIVWRGHYYHLPFYTVPVPVPQPAIPDGWRLVPVEPTEEMLRSAFYEAGGSYENKEGIYRAMIAAVPEPSK